MTWNCCTPTGECQRGPGCPAGVLCTQSPGCTDTACPGHPGVAARSMPPRVDLSKVRLIGQPAGASAKRNTLRTLLGMVAKRLSFGLALGFAVVAAATCSTEPAPGVMHPTKVVTV